MTDTREQLQTALGGRYDIKRELGRGGMAVVYLAEDTRHQRHVAIKVFDADVAGAVGHERFLREIQVAANLTHPHILPLHDSGDADGLLYYVMPYIEGETVRDRLLRLGQFSVNEAVRIAREVADALAYAHRQGLVHRDIKPENVMLSSGHALVMDFGICRAVGAASVADGLTRVGLTLGTPAYMSPEQWTASERVDGRSDLYSLACMLAEMLVGEPPFTGLSTGVVMARHIQQEPPSLRVVRPDLPGPLDAVIRRALAKVPEERFASAEVFSEALTASVTQPAMTIPDSAPTTSTGALPTGVPAATVRSRRWLSLAAAALVVVAAYGVYVGISDRMIATTDQRIRMIVLPFRSTEGEERQYFADGVTDEITSRLASLDGLAVIARTTTMQYRNTTKTIAQIGQELNVSYVVEGSVRCACPPNAPPTDDDSLVISARLIKVSDDVGVYNQDYRIRRADLFSVHSTIAEKIAETLQLALLEPDRRRLQARPTDNLAAYDLYLRGNNAYYRSWAREDVEAALGYYQRAVEMDARFAPAHARIAMTHAWMHRLAYDATDARLELARVAMERALELNPDLPEAHFAAALYHYWGRWDYDAAMDEFLEARRLRPNDEEVTRYIGHIRRRQGKWADAIAAYRDAAELDPKSYLAWYNLAEAYSLHGDYENARREFEKITILAPDFFENYLQLAYIAVRTRGSDGVAEARRILDDAAQRIPPDRWRPLYGFWLFGMSRIAYRDAEILEWAAPGVYGLDTASYHIARAEIASRAGDEPVARVQWDSARVYLERLNARSSTEVTQGRLAFVYASLGRRDEALRLGRQAASAMARDKYDGTDWVINLARIYMMLGDNDAAVSQLDLVLSIPSRISVEWVRADPIWRPLWNHAGFQKLLSEQRPQATVPIP